MPKPNNEKNTNDMLQQNGFLYQETALEEYIQNYANPLWKLNALSSLPI